MSAFCSTAAARWLSMAALGAATCGAWALQPLITDDTGTQGAGGQQVELSWTRERMRAGPARDSAQSGAPTYTFGATDTLDLSASLGHIRRRGEGGAANG